MDIGMVRKESPALRQSYGMRINPLDIIQHCAWKCDEVMPDVKQRFANDLHVVLKKQVEVLQHRAGKAVFDGDHGCVNRSACERMEDVSGQGAWLNGCPRKHGQRCLVTEGARLSLDGDSHFVATSLRFGPDFAPMYAPVTRLLPQPDIGG